MEYLLLIYSNEKDFAVMPQAEHERVTGAYMAYTQALLDGGGSPATCISFSTSCSRTRAVSGSVVVLAVRAISCASSRRSIASGMAAPPIRSCASLYAAWDRGH